MSWLVYLIRIGIRATLVVRFFSRLENLRKDNFATTNLLRTPVNAWSAKLSWPIALRRIRICGITKDRQGYHHLPPTPQPENTRQTKVTSSLDNMSTLLVTTLALARNFHLYQDSSTRAPAVRTDDEPASK